MKTKLQSERVMPASKEAEIAVLGAIFLDESGYAYNQAVSALTPEDFTLDSHRKIFTAMIEVFGEGEKIDFVTLAERLTARGELVGIGGVAYMSSVTDGLPRVKNISQYVKILRNKTQLRQAINLATSTIEAAYEQETPASHVIGTMQEQVLSLLADVNKEGAARISDFAEETWTRLIDRRNSENRLIGFSTGVDALDYRTTGIKRKEFWTIGGRTGDGKTALALQMAAANAAQGVPVAYFSIEMDRDALLERIWAAHGSVNYGHIINPKKLTPVEINDLVAAKEAVSEWPLFIEDSESFTPMEIEARSRLLIRKHGIAIVFVDYMQIVNAPGRDERQQMTKVSQTLRRLAKRENIAVVGLSQMPRPRDSDMNKRPNKFCLKESGSLENDSNAVILIFRPVDEYDQYNGADEIITAKKRSGITGIDEVHFIGQYQRFEARI